MATWLICPVCDTTWPEKDGQRCLVCGQRGERDNEPEQDKTYDD